MEFSCQYFTPWCIQTTNSEQRTHHRFVQCFDTWSFSCRKNWNNEHCIIFIQLVCCLNPLLWPQFFFILSFCSESEFEMNLNVNRRFDAAPFDFHFGIYIFNSLFDIFSLSSENINHCLEYNIFGKQICFYNPHSNYRNTNVYANAFLNSIVFMRPSNISYLHQNCWLNRWYDYFTFTHNYKDCRIQNNIL